MQRGRYYLSYLSSEQGVFRPSCVHVGPFRTAPLGKGLLVKKFACDTNDPTLRIDVTLFHSDAASNHTTDTI